MVSLSCVRLCGVHGAAVAVLCLWSAAMGCGATLQGDAVSGDASLARDGAAAGDTGALGAGADAAFLDDCPLGRAPARRQYRCDPLSNEGCRADESCRPFVEYPTLLCAAEVYHTRCFSNGPVAPGGFCRIGNDCAAGSGCFVTGAMNRCLRLCSFDGGVSACPRGTVCEPTDQPDFGACQ